MNCNDLQARFETRYRDTSNQILADADVVSYLNDAYMDVIAATPFWPFLEARNTTLSVTAGTGTASLGADTLKVTAVYNATDDYALTPIDGTADYRRLFPNPDANLGTPTHYRLMGSTLEVYPWPAVTTEIDVDYRNGAVTALATTGEPVFPEQYHRCIVSGALAYAYEDDGNLQMAEVHRARFDRIVSQMMDDLLGNRTEAYPQILDTGC